MAEDDVSSCEESMIIVSVLGIRERLELLKNLTIIRVWYRVLKENDDDYQFYVGALQAICLMGKTVGDDISHVMKKLMNKK